MTQEQLIGFGFLLIGAICGGSFGLPSKFARKDTPWEVLWGPFFFFVTILIPVILAPLLVTDLGGVYEIVGWEKILPVLIFGLLWGLGSMTLGKSFAFIGLSLAYALNYGAQIIFGSMMPMAIFSADQFLTSHGYVIMSGVAVCVLGVIISGKAAILKERSMADAASETDPPADATAGVKKPKLLIGLTIGILSGVLCACYAVAANYGTPVSDEAKIVAEAALAAGQTTSLAAAQAPAWAMTALVLWGGAISACGYCVVQLTRNKTWGHLTRSGVGRILVLAAVMAILHDAAIFFFGLSLSKLGALAVPVGYPVFMSFAIIVGNIHGFRTGEWKGASRKSIKLIVVGILILVIGVSVLAKGNTMAELERKEQELQLKQDQGQQDKEQAQLNAADTE